MWTPHPQAATKRATRTAPVWTGIHHAKILGLRRGIPKRENVSEFRRGTEEWVDLVYRRLSCASAAVARISQIRSWIDLYGPAGPGYPLKTTAKAKRGPASEST